MFRKGTILLGASVLTPLIAHQDLKKSKEQQNLHQNERRLQVAEERCARIVQRFKEEYGVPGVCVGVSLDGKTVWNHAAGYSNVENLVPCTPDTSMRIASISKAITMTLIAKLVQEGKLDLDAPVQKYVPEFPNKTFNGEEVEITTRHLISHTSGIRHYDKKLPATAQSEKENKEVETENDEEPKPEAPETKDKKDEFSLPEYYNHKHYNNVIDALNMFKHDPLHYKPGTQYLYSSHGFTLASAVVERAGNAPFLEQLMQTLRAMSMHQTLPDVNNSLISDRASYFSYYCRSSNPKFRHRLLNVRSVNNSYKWAAGGLVSTLSDLLLFANTMLYCMQAPAHSEGYLSQSTMHTLWSPVTDMHSLRTPVLCRNPSKYAQGWMVEPGMLNAAPLTNWTKSNYTCHSGGAIGATSILLIVPKDNASTDVTANESAISNPPKGICVAVLMNLQEAGNVYALATQIAYEFDLAVNSE